MTDRPMKMSREQFEALFAAVELAGDAAGLAAKNHARRLLVEPEQAKTDQPKYYGDCKGGPLNMARVGSDDDVVPVTGGAHHWSRSCNWWAWVEDQPKPKPTHDGPCKGGPLDGSSMAMDDDIVQRPGGEYQWSGFSQDWFWVPDVDPDLTTFGELEDAERFSCHYSSCREFTFRKATLSPGVDKRRNAFCEETGLIWAFSDSDPVRRLPKPEFKS